MKRYGLSQGESSFANECYYIEKGSVNISVTGPDGDKSVLESRTVIHDSSIGTGETCYRNPLNSAALSHSCVLCDQAGSFLGEKCAPAS